MKQTNVVKFPKKKRFVSRVRSSRMHPGWQVFFLAYSSGFITLATILIAILQPSWDCLWPAGIALVLFYCGGSKAEDLTDRE